METLVLALVLLVAVALVFRFLIWPPIARERAKEAAEASGRMPPCAETCEVVAEPGAATAHFECGHEGPTAFKLLIWGETRGGFRVKEKRVGCPGCFLRDLLEGSIRCGNCGYAILRDDPVALCVDDPKIGRKEWKTLIDGQLALCLRWDCEGGPGFCGHWTGNGIKPAFPDGRTMIGHVFATGQPTLVVSHDPDDPSSRG